MLTVVLGLAHLAQPSQQAEQPQHMQRVQATQGAMHISVNAAAEIPAITPVVFVMGKF